MWNFDPFLFTQIGLDSGSLTMPGAAIHRFPEQGLYRGNVLLNGNTQGTFALQVTTDAAELQANIDLATIASGAGAKAPAGDCGCSQSSPVLRLNPQGYAVFHVSSGAGGLAAVVSASGSSPESTVFDSRSLQQGDMFTATVLRPGSYTATCQGGKNVCAFSVAYPPAPGKAPYVPPVALTVQAGADGFNPSTFSLASGQGLLFRVQSSDTRIVISLDTPDDGPSGGGPRKRAGYSTGKRAGAA